MFWLFVVALWTAMLLSPLVLLFVFLPSGRDCPRCNHETLPIQSGALRPVRRLMSLRWCIGCGWQGITRHAKAGRPVPGLETIVEQTHEQDSETPWKNNSAS